MENRILGSAAIDETPVLTRLCSEMREVIQRICPAVRHVPLEEVADRPGIEEMEEALDLEARKLQWGEGDPLTWRSLLQEYEARWMAVLRELQGFAQERRCA